MVLETIEIRLSLAEKGRWSWIYSVSFVVKYSVNMYSYLLILFFLFGWLIDWFIVWFLTLFSKVFQLHSDSSAPIHPGVPLIGPLHNILQSHWLLSHITIVETMDCSKRGMNPVATTIINPRKEYCLSRVSNQRSLFRLSYGAWLFCLVWECLFNFYRAFNC